MSSLSFVEKAQLLITNNNIISSYAVANGNFSALRPELKPKDATEKTYPLNRRWLWVNTLHRTDWYALVLAVKVIITQKFKNNNKINCTYKQLLTENIIQELLTDFFGDNALFDVTLDIGNVSSCGYSDEAIGYTSKNTDGSYKIVIDEEYINSNETPTIYIAQILLHEAMHANLYAEVRRLSGSMPSDTSFEAL